MKKKASIPSTSGVRVKNRGLVVFKKRFLNIFVLALLGTGMISLGEYLYNSNTPLWVNAIIIFVIFIISFLLSLLNDKKDWLLMSLVEISNNLPKGETKTTSVSDFLEHSDEEALKNGDKVIILTNDLKNYDLLPNTLNIIAKNIKEGVVYEYYLPLKHEAQLWEQVNNLASAILERTDTSSVLNLKIYIVDLSLIYSFSIVEKNSLKKAYWYLSMETNCQDANLLIVELQGIQKVKLEQVLARIKGKKQTIKDIIFDKKDM